MTAHILLLENCSLMDSFGPDPRGHPAAGFLIGNGQRVFMVNAKIMIVEDDFITSTDLDFRLRNMGYAISAVCATAEEALLQAQTLLPDLVIMDIALDGPMDGIKAGRLLNSTLNLPIVFLTAMSDRETLHRIKQARPLGFMTKPVSDYKLKNVIEQALHLARLNYPASLKSN